jgi:hypothetical protein
MKELTSDKVGQFLRAFLLYIGGEWGLLRSTPLSTANLATFFVQQPPAASRRSYVSETNVVAKVTDSTINRTPCIALAKPVEISNRTFVFHLFLETTPKQWPTWPVQDATDRERKIRGYPAWGEIEGGRLVDS